MVGQPAAWSDIAKSWLKNTVSMYVMLLAREVRSKCEERRSAMIAAAKITVELGRYWARRHESCDNKAVQHAAGFSL